MGSLKDRIAGAEQAAATEGSPIASLFKNSQPTTPKAPVPTTGAQSGFGKTQFVDLPVDILDEMPQRFRISEDQVENLTEDIRLHGIIHRIIVRPHPERPGRYQIIAGRHRRRGAIGAGYRMVPCEIRELDDTEARLLMISSNLQQRDNLLPSEKAWAYREQMELLAHQGKRTDFEKLQNGSEALGKNGKQTSCNDCTKLRSDETVAAGTKDSARTVQNYIRLTYLLPELLEAVDAGKLGIVVGVTLSYLLADNQRVIYQYFFEDHKQTINSNLADALRIAGEKEPVTEELIARILSPAVKPKPRKVTIKMRPIQNFFPGASPKEIEKQIIEILTEYFKRNPPKEKAGG